MRKELDKKLCRDFPNLYADRCGDMMSTCMCWGFECGDGWFDIIYDLSSKLEPMIVKIIKKDNKWYRRTCRLINNWRRWFINYKLRLNKTVRELNSNMSWKQYREIYRPYYPKASQVKEKFGTLRFYMNCETEEMSKAITEAEELSSITCETCGKPGKIRGRGWYYTACNKHTRKGD